MAPVTVRFGANWGMSAKRLQFAVMHSARLCAVHRRRQAAGRMNAGGTGIKAEDALHITFDLRRGETEGRQSCHAVAADAMEMAHRPTEFARL